MLNTYEEAIEWIHGLLPHGVKPGLKRVEWMLSRLGHPERKLRSIHVGGTNGKGSTVTFLRSMMQEGGYRIGTFTSPYVEEFNERIAVNGESISNEDFLRAANRVKPLADELSESKFGSPTEFEAITVIAMLFFAETAYPDFVIFEVGLGGRLDSTNVIYPMLSVITNVGYDHTEILGDSLTSIAKEKAGIIKAGTGVVSGCEQPEVIDQIRKVCAEKKAKLYLPGNGFSFAHESSNTEGETFSYQSVFAKREQLSIRLKGAHQVKNAAIALMAVDYLNKYFALVLEENDIREGLKKAFWPGRFEAISSKPCVIVDGAHNPEGIRTLIETVRVTFPGNRVKILFAAATNKNTKEMLRLLNTLSSEIALTSFSFEKAQTAEYLRHEADFTPVISTDDWNKAFDHLLQGADEQTVILVTGSLYFISEVRKERRCVSRK
ncbi:MAG TPA: folylpolyglutamate synthase/dihydrofolate synthase family protein [Bacillales bacterium]|nr:folylpolyglutamate synthase/dihydrofolate synthase family protein [Bacillales bacterium]